MSKNYARGLLVHATLQELNSFEITLEPKIVEDLKYLQAYYLRYLLAKILIVSTTDET